MASEFIETMQKLEKTAYFIPKMGLSFLYEAVSRIKTISDFINRFADMGSIIKHLREVESKFFMLEEMMTLDEVTEYLGASKSLNNINDNCQGRQEIPVPA